MTQVKRGTPAYEAGVNVGDELIAMGDYRVPPDGLEGAAQSLPAGSEGVPAGRPAGAPDAPARGLRREAEPRWKLEPDPAATQEQRARLEDWLRGSAAEVEAAADEAAVEEPSHW